MVDETRKAAFIAELHTLLEKYNASIDWTCDSGSDMHGVSGEKMLLTMDKKTVLEVHDSYITARNIKEAQE